LRDQKEFQEKSGGVPGIQEPMSQFIFTKFHITERIDEDKCVYDGVRGTDFFDLDEDKEVYLGGSCFDNSLRVAKAGAGIVQEKANRKTMFNKIGYALPSYLDQSSVVAEIVALLFGLAHIVAGGTATFATDCAAVFFGFRDLAKAARYTCTHAGLWRQVADQAKGKNIRVRKVKAHRSEAQALGAGDLDDFIGNDAADVHAKRMARDASFRESEVLREQERVKRIRFLRKYHQSALEEYYREEQAPFMALKTKKELSAKEVIALDERGELEMNGHRVYSKKGELICKDCLVHGKVVGVFRNRCEGIPPVVKRITDGLAKDGAKGHNIWASKVEGGPDQGETLVFCTRCGCTSVKAVVGLAKSCHGPDAKGRDRAVITRIREGEHPDRRRGGENWTPVAHWAGQCRLRGCI
jgi:hypothetical protein